jgi:hypothetical protein
MALPCPLKLPWPGLCLAIALGSGYIACTTLRALLHSMQCFPSRQRRVQIFASVSSHTFRSLPIAPSVANSASRLLHWVCSNSLSPCHFRCIVPDRLSTFPWLRCSYGNIVCSCYRFSSVLHFPSTGRSAYLSSNPVRRWSVGPLGLRYALCRLGDSPTNTVYSFAR